MIDRDHELSVSRQAKALGISRDSVYPLPQPTSEADLALMCRIDELPLEYPFAGSRMLKGLLRAEGHEVGRLHVSTLMKKMGIEALYRRPNTSKLARGHKVYPCLSLPAADPGGDPPQPGRGRGHHLHPDGARLRLPRRRGRLVQPQGPGLEAVDHAGGGLSRIEALQEALARHGRPESFNSDQGSQFTSAAFIAVLKAAEIAISRDGKGAGRDNVFVERLWRTVKYEEVYRRAYASVSKARVSIGRYFGFCNGRRPHSSLGGQTPDQAHLNQPSPTTGGGVTHADIHSAAARSAEDQSAEDRKLVRHTEPALGIARTGGRVARSA